MKFILELGWSVEISCSRSADEIKRREGLRSNQKVENMA